MKLRAWTTVLPLLATLEVAGDANAQHGKTKKHPKPGKRPPAGVVVPAAKPPEAPPRPIRGPLFAVERRTLDNGLRVVLAPDTRAPVVSVGLFYDVGTRNEERGATGLASLTAAMMTEGSANVLRGEHERLQSSRAAEPWVSVSVELTSLGASAPASELPLLLWLEADRLKSLGMTDAAFEAARRQRLASSSEGPAHWGAGRFFSQPERRLRALVFQGVYPLEHDEAAEQTELPALKPDAARVFHGAHYGPGSAVVVVAGDFEADHAMELIHRFFDTAKKRERPVAALVAAPTEQTSQRTATVDDARARSSRLLAGFSAPPVGSEDNDALVAAAHILGGTRASRLGLRLLFEKGAAVNVRAGLQGQRVADLFTVEITLTDEASRPDAQRALDAELEALGKLGPTEAEMSAFRAHVESRAWESLGRLDSRARRLGEAELLLGDARLAVTEAGRLGQLTRDRVRAAAARYLVPSRRSLVEVAPPRDDLTRKPAGPPPGGPIPAPGKP